MKNIPSPPSGRFGHSHHEREGSLREHDSHNGEAHDRRHGRGGRRSQHDHGREHFRGSRRGHGHGHGHGHGQRFGRREAAFATADRAGVREIFTVAQDIRTASRSVLHHGTPEQLAQTQQLLQETRRAIYLILAEQSPSATSEPAETAEPSTPPETEENPET